MGKHILIMNDTQEILDLFRKLLEEEGYRVTLHSYGTLDLAFIQQLQPNLIIADFPPLAREEQGWQFVQKLRMWPPTAEVPLLICTTNMRVVRHTEGWLTTKGIAVIPKPFTLDELIQAVTLQLHAKPKQSSPAENGLRSNTVP